MILITGINTIGKKSTGFKIIGNWSNLVFSICLFILDILMLIPISLLGQRIERKLKAYEYEKGQQTA